MAWTSLPASAVEEARAQRVAGAGEEGVEEGGFA